jgi:hypothetical protein
MWEGLFLVDQGANYGSRACSAASSSRQTLSRIGQIIMHVVSDVLVIVPKDVADSGNLGPWNDRMACFHQIEAC